MMVKDELSVKKLSEDEYEITQTTVEIRNKAHIKAIRDELTNSLKKSKESVAFLEQRLSDPGLKSV